MVPAKSVPSGDPPPRIFFITGDVLLNTAIGAATAVSISWLLPRVWNVPARMLSGMVVGMLVAMVLATLATPLLGAFEVMLPSMASGMLAGMVAPMFAHDMTSAALTGATVGLVTIGGTYFLTFWSNRG